MDETAPLRLFVFIVLITVGSLAFCIASDDMRSEQINAITTIENSYNFELDNNIQAEQEQKELEKQRQKKQTQLEQQQAIAQQPNYTTSTSTLTKSGGVNYYNGSRETWYSSKQLYHRNTANWTLNYETGRFE